LLLSDQSLTCETWKLAEILIFVFLSFFDLFCLLLTLMKDDWPFGGKVVIFGGDFRQTLPVVLGGSIFDQAAVCMINSELWSNVYTFELTESVRLSSATEADSSRVPSDPTF
jgi:hypothetical protein